jgi:hypothetical protein
VSPHVLKLNKSKPYIYVTKNSVAYMNYIETLRWIGHMLRKAEKKKDKFIQCL